MGVLRFARIGFPHLHFPLHRAFVGTFEIVCGLPVLIGLLTRLASAPLRIVISTTVATTKVPQLFRPAQGFWFMISGARTDFAIFCSLIFLAVLAPGRLSLDITWTLFRKCSSENQLAEQCLLRTPVGK